MGGRYIVDSDILKQSTVRPLEAILRACSQIESVGIHEGLPVIVCPVLKRRH